MDISTLGTVVGIVAICYVIGLGCKAYEKIPDKGNYAEVRRFIRHMEAWIMQSM